METRDEASASQTAGSILAGVFVELYDAAGHCLGQAVYMDWSEQVIPRVGDTMTIDATHPWSSRARLQGRVKARDFDVQQNEAGRPCVWVRIDLEVLPSDRNRASGRPRSPRAIEFSAN